jgi:phage/plasmid-like protein (TIGR03299 family)
VIRQSALCIKTQGKSTPLWASSKKEIKMSALLTVRQSGFVEMAYAGAAPWHQSGQKMSDGMDLDQWRKAAGLDWEAKSAPVMFQADALDGTAMEATLNPATDKKVVYRSDTGTALGVVGSKFAIVQPRKVIDFFEREIRTRGYKMETAGTLAGGRRIWAMARTGESSSIGGSADKIENYLFLATGMDGSLATTASFTSVRIVCNNTLTLALDKTKGQAVKVRHNTTFIEREVKDDLGLSFIESEGAFKGFMLRMNRLANQPVNRNDAEDLVIELLDSSKKDPKKAPGFIKIMGLFNGEGRGAMMDGSFGTKWGLLNAITEYADYHVRSASQSQRFDSATFGAGATLKREAVSLLEAANFGGIISQKDKPFSFLETV